MIIIWWHNDIPCSFIIQVRYVQKIWQLDLCKLNTVFDFSTKRKQNGGWLCGKVFAISLSRLSRVSVVFTWKRAQNQIHIFDKAPLMIPCIIVHLTPQTVRVASLRILRYSRRTHESHTNYNVCILTYELRSILAINDSNIWKLFLYMIHFNHSQMGNLLHEWQIIFLIFAEGIAERKQCTDAYNVCVRTTNHKIKSTILYWNSSQWALVSQLFFRIQ